MNNSVMNPFTQGFDPSATIPNGPRISRIASPSPLKSTMIPRQNTAACITLPFWCRKYDIVIGIIGKTQGVKIDARPNPNAVSRNAPKSWSPATVVPGGGGACGSLYPAGITGALADAAGSIVTV